MMSVAMKIAVILDVMVYSLILTNVSEAPATSSFRVISFKPQLCKIVDFSDWCDFFLVYQPISS
jgi:hypothetical protein